MRFPLRLLCFFAIGATLVRAAHLPTGPETLLADPAHDPVWRELFARLASNQTRMSKFVETRHIPFRKTPVMLKGEIRIVPEMGLSLRYLEPEERILIVDNKGLLMRDESGRDRAMPSDSRAQAVTSALVSILRFDLPALDKAFAVHGRRENNTWMLAFVPREPALAELIGTTTVTGEKFQLTRIEMTKSAAQSIEIAISDPQEGVIFTEAALKKFFR